MRAASAWRFSASGRETGPRVRAPAHERRAAAGAAATGWHGRRHFWQPQRISSSRHGRAGARRERANRRRPSAGAPPRFRALLQDVLTERVLLAEARHGRCALRRARLSWLGPLALSQRLWHHDVAGEEARNQQSVCARSAPLPSFAAASAAHSGGGPRGGGAGGGHLWGDQVISVLQLLAPQF